MQFSDRHHAGKTLAKLLETYRENKTVVVLGLARGGVVIAFEIATTLGLDLDVICPRKIGAPHNPEFAIGAITETGEGIFNEDYVIQTNASKSYLEEKINEEKAVAQARLKIYRKSRPAINIKDKTVILADDGLATGATMKAAIMATRKQEPKKIIVAIPVAPKETLAEITALADKVYCPYAPSLFYAVGQFYTEFSSVNDTTIIKLLEEKRGSDVTE